MINWPLEIPLIQAVASKHSIDYQFIRTIRQVENGSDGRQFGVLEAGINTYAQQLEVCCATVAHRLEAYPANPLQRCYSPSGFARIRYTPSFISYFSSVWAPIGSNNDPGNLNANWYKNASTVYTNFITGELTNY